MQAKIKKKANLLLINTADMALKRRALSILEELDPKDGEAVIDVGCGDGYYLYLLSNLGIKLKLTGTDIDSEALKTAKQNLKNEKISLATANLMGKLPFNNNTFDKAVMSEVAEHLPSDVKGLKEVLRILKPGGTLALTVPHANYPFLWDPVNWVLERFFSKHIKSGFFAGIWNQHIRLYKSKQIKEALEKAGFHVSKVEVQTRWCLPFNHYLINIGARMLKAKILPADFHSQVNKFQEFNPKKRSLIPKLYFDTAEFVDKFNKRDDYRVGMTIFVKAEKPKNRV